MPGALDAGQIVDDRYAIEERIGEDALGTIWRAHDRGLGRTIILRAVQFPGDVFRDDPRRRQAALTAGRQAIKVDHPRAVHVYDAFIDGEGLVMVTEVAEGRTLESLVERKPLPPKRVAAIGLDILEALEAAHAIGVVHGSVCPAVVLVPERGRARLTGLGLAPTFRDAASTTWIEAAGSPACIAPEQANLQGSGEASDLWALGATLYYAVEGVYPFSGPSCVATLVRIAHDPPRPAEKAGDLAPLLERMMTREPRERPSVEVIRAVLTEVSGIVREALAAEAPGPKRRARKERVRAEPQPEAEADGQDQGDGRDWSAAVAPVPITRRTGKRVRQNTEADLVFAPEPEAEPAAGLDNADGDEPWVDWAPDGELDAADVWLPGTDSVVTPAEPLPGTAGPPVRTADPARPAAPPAPVTPLAPLAPLGETAPPPGPGAEDEEPRRYRSTPSWPPPPKRRVGITILCLMIAAVMLLLLVTEGRVGRPSSSRTTLSASQRPVLAADPAAVPNDWITYRHPSVDFGLAYPPGWTLREEGSVVTVRDPTGGAELRVDYRQPPGPDPQRAWEDLERSFSLQHPNDYKRLQLSPASFLGNLGALWEFTFTDNSVAVHAVDVGFLTKKYGFALYFEATANNWSNMLPTFHAFLGSVRAPK